MPGVAVAGGLSRGEPDRRGQGTILVYNHNAGGHVPQPLRGNVRGTRRFVGGRPPTRAGTHDVHETRGNQ